jgi:hypothetical protein
MGECVVCGRPVYLDRFATRGAGAAELVWRHEDSGRTYCAPTPGVNGHRSYCALPPTHAGVCSENGTHWR